MSTLLLRLAAPMQAWGTDSKFETRRTDTEPSKSGVTGLLAAAMGIRRDGDLSRLNSLRFGVRVDREGKLLRDFHTVHSEKTSYITYRYYLCDAVFVVGLEGEEAFLNEINDALHAPAFPLYLGRRSCPPTPPVSLGVSGKSLEEALSSQAWQGQSFDKELMPDRLRCVIESEKGDFSGKKVRDLPVSFSPIRRRYGFRTEKESFTAIRAAVETEHDPMTEL